MVHLPRSSPMAASVDFEKLPQSSTMFHATARMSFSSVALQSMTSAKRFNTTLGEVSIEVVPVVRRLRQRSSMPVQLRGVLPASKWMIAAVAIWPAGQLTQRFQWS